MKLLRMTRQGIMAAASVLMLALPAHAQSQQELNEALMKVCCDECDDVAQARELIRKGADMNCQKKVWGENYTPLKAAAWSGCDDIVFLLLQQGADVNPNIDSPPLHSAIMGGYNISLTHDFNNGFTPKKGNHYKLIINMLLKYGANVNASDSCGETPLMKAVSCSDIYIVRLLVQNGAHLNAQNNRGETALITASYSLGPYGDYMNDDDINYDDPCWAKPEDIIALLISKGADTSIRDNEGHDFAWHQERASDILGE